MKLKHWYHVYADGNWHLPFTEHMTALTESGLMDALDEINVGIVGCDEHREEVKLVLPPKSIVVMEACTGYEQLTMETIDASEPAYIFYAHTKGASNPDRLRVDWRHSMTNGTVYGWKTCVNALTEGYDAVGLYWQTVPQKHFSGTYWWANSNYISTLPPQMYNTRFDAEMWIGKSPRPYKIGDLCPGFISPMNMLKRPEGSVNPTFVEGHVQIKAINKVAGFQRNHVYDVPLTPFISNCIKKGHFEVVSSNPSPLKTIYVNR